MNVLLRFTLALAGLAIAAQAAAQVTFYEHEGFTGRSYTAEQGVDNFQRLGFNARASSVVVLNDPWEVCESIQHGGRCAVLRPGRYPSLAAMGLNDRISSARVLDRNARVDNRRYAPPHRSAQIAFYAREDFQGRSFTTERKINNFQRAGFDGHASSAVVMGDLWEVCEDVRFRGRCVVLRPGRYPSLAAMGLDDHVSSARIVSQEHHVDDDRFAPAPPAPVYDSRRRGNERLYQANVTSVQAVLGNPGQRCWVEQEQISSGRTGANVPAAIAGAVIGGILGHQIGGGTGKDIATVGGAVVGGVVGANIGRGEQQVQTRDIQRCESVPNQARPDYWNVTYDFRGQEHRIQMVTPPGRTVTVNAQGEPRA